jgi:serine/threonine protein kinase
MPLPIDPICLSCGASNLPNASVCRVCGAPLEVQEFLPAKTRVGHFEIEKVLGRGGFGITYKAQDVTSGTTVALKELMPEGMASRGANGAVNIHTNQVADFEEIKTKFIAEAQLLRKITDAASAKFVDLVAQNQTLYMAMDFVEGVTLESRIARGSLLSIKETRSILRDVLGVLEEMHLLNILHRDIKPANIILQPGGAKLIDFGSGLRFQKNKTIRVTSRVLTPAYAPLELYGQNIRLSPAADLYSLAATMYEAMTGIRIPSALERANGAKLQSLSSLEPSAPEGLVNAIDKALEIRVDARPKSVQEFRKLLDVSSNQAIAKPRSANPTSPSMGAPNMATGQVNPTKIFILDRKVPNYVTNPLVFLIFSSFGIASILHFIKLTGNLVNLIFSWLAFSTIFSMIQVPLGWILVQPICWAFDRLTNGPSRLPRSFYSQSMFGLYGLGVFAILLYLVILSENIHSFSAFLSMFISSIPIFVIGMNFLWFIALFFEDSKIRKSTFKVPFSGLHLLIPALIGGLFLNQFNQPTSTTPSSQTNTTSKMNSSVQPFTSSQTNTTSGMASTVQPTTSSPVVAFADAVIAGNKWVCKEHLGKPIPAHFDFTTDSGFDNGLFIISLDDESFNVSNAIASREEAKVLKCLDVANDVAKFSFSGVTDSKVFGVWEFLEWVHMQFIGYVTADPKIVLITAKPIVGTRFLERAFYRHGKKLMLVSTAALKPINYKTSKAAKTIFLERIITIVKQKLTKDSPNIKNLEDLDKLWRK